MSEETKQSNALKAKTLDERAKKLLRDARAAEWAIIKAEEFQEKFELSNATIGVYTALFDEIKGEVESMTFMERLTGDKEFQDKHKDLAKTYFKQLSEIDGRFRKKEDEYKKKLMEDAKGMSVDDLEDLDG